MKMEVNYSNSILNPYAPVTLYGDIDLGKSGSDNGLLPHGAKLLHKLMLSNRQSEQFHS